MSLIETALNLSGTALMLSIYAAVWAGLLAAVVLVVNVLFRRWLSSRQMGLLWGIVLLRLLVPIAPSSSFSLQNLLPPAPEERTYEEADRESYADLGSATSDSEPLGTTIGVEDSRPPVSVSIARVPTAREIATEPLDWSFVDGDPLFAAVVMAWLTGGVASFFWTAVIYLQFCRKLNQVPVCDDERLCGLWEECRRLAGVRKSIPLLMFDGVLQPAILGLFRPKLLLPLDAADLTDQQLRMVMLHELSHVRYGDIAANWVLVFIRAVHWWNPIFWLAATCYQSLREQSCDAFALRRIEGQPARDYSELLLMLAARRPAGPRWRVMLPASILGFLSSFFRKRAIGNRLKALRFAGVTRNRWYTAGVTVLLCLVAVCGLTDASTAKPPPDRTREWLFRTDSVWNISDAAPQRDPAPPVTRTYDVEKALARIAVDEGSIDIAHQTLNGILKHILRGSTGRFHELTDEWAQERLTLDDTTLTVNAPLNVHAEITRNLETWEQGGLAQICVETQFITSEKDVAASVGISWRFLETFSTDRAADLTLEPGFGRSIIRAGATVDEYFPIVVATLNDQQAFQLRQALQGERTANLIHAPKITLFNGQKAQCFDGVKRPFVIGFQDHGTDAPQPKIVTIDQGTKLILRTTITNDARRVQLEGHLELTAITDVRAVSTLLRGNAAAIQIPRVERRHIDIASNLQDGESLLIGCIPTFDRKQFLYVLLTVRHI
jgi:beta-lactamase regulating signal transducer with metallopeptidase domain